MANRITPPDVLWNDTVFNGSVSFGTAPSFPAGAIDNADIAEAAGIDYSKLINERKQSHEVFAEGVSIIAVPSKFATIVTGTSGTQIGLDAVIGSTMGASTATIDLMKGTIGSTAFATVLSTPIALTSTSALFTRYSATFATTGLPMLVGESYRIVVTITGTTASAAKGLWVTHRWSEAPA